MREPEEIERLRFAETPSVTVRNRGPTKLDEPRLVGMKVQSKTSEPRLEIGKELLCLVPVLETDDRIVCVAHDNHVTGGAPRRAVLPKTLHRSTVVAPTWSCRIGSDYALT